MIDIYDKMEAKTQCSYSWSYFLHTRMLNMRLHPSKCPPQTPFSELPNGKWRRIFTVIPLKIEIHCPWQCTFLCNWTKRNTNTYSVSKDDKLSNIPGARLLNWFLWRYLKFIWIFFDLKSVSSKRFFKHSWFY